jgi:hypothetical protein
VYAALFGAGSFLYGKTAQGMMWLVLFVLSTIYLARLLPRLWSSSSDEAVEPPVLARIGAEADD